MKNTCGFIIYNKNEKSILIGHATNSIDNLWSIPKGKQEKNESLLQAAIRETKEEANISIDFLKKCIVYQLTPHVYTSGKKRLNAFLAITEEMPKNVKCISYFEDSYGNRLPEFDMLKWVNVKELIDMLYNIHYTQHNSIIEALKIIKKYNY